MSGVFEDVALVVYDVEPARLAPLLPPLTAPDVVDGQAFVGLMAARLREPRLLGCGLPADRDLAQVSFQLYVREGEHHGVVTIREHVSHPLLAWGGRRLFREAFVHQPVTCTQRDLAGGDHQITYELQAAGRTQRVSVLAEGATRVPDPVGLEKFFAQRPFGYALSRRGDTLCYALSHPRWRSSPVRSAEVDWDFGGLYGEPFGVLQGRAPCAVMFAEGSPFSASLPWIQRPAPERRFSLA